MTIRIICFIVFVVFIGIGLIYKYLVKNQKIKSNVLLRFFYEEIKDEDFLASWKKTEAKGFLRFTLKCTVIGAAIGSLIGILFIITKRPFYGHVGMEILRDMLVTGSIMGFISSIINWMSNEVRERRIREKEQESSES